jgi:protein SCO1/2
MLRLVRWLATALCVVLLLLWAAVWIGTGRPNGSPFAALERLTGLRPGGGLTAGGGIELPPGLSLGGPFELTDQTGKPVTQADFRGKWLLVYFGYTTCPDVCPTELQSIAQALDKLGPKAAQVVPIFITIDPERDTPAVLADYVRQFSDRMVGLTGSPAQIATVAREFRVYYAKVPPKAGETYLMDHSSFVYLLDADGRLSGLFRPDMSAADLAADIGGRL